MPDLVEQIREKMRRLAEVEAEGRVLRAELVAIRQAVLADGHIEPSPPSHRQSLNSTVMAAEVLRKAGRPMHVNEIISAIEREFHVSVRYATLVGNISRLVKKNREFERVGPNRFGLLNWSVDREAAELFGREEYERQNGPD